MAGVTIGVGPHKASHTAVAISGDEEPLGRLRVRASAAQAERLLEWAAAWPERSWAVEGAGGLGHLLAQQLLSAGERVLDVQPKLGARVRLLATGNVNKNDPNDARSVAVAALRSPGVREARPDDHAAVLKVWSKRRRDLGSSRTQVVCRLHAVLCELVPGGVPKKIIAAHAARLNPKVVPRTLVCAVQDQIVSWLSSGVMIRCPHGHHRYTSVTACAHCLIATTPLVSVMAGTADTTMSRQACRLIPLRQSRSKRTYARREPWVCKAWPLSRSAMSA
jgi:transposase